MVGLRRTGHLLVTPLIVALDQVGRLTSPTSGQDGRSISLFNIDLDRRDVADISRPHGSRRVHSAALHAGRPVRLGRLSTGAAHRDARPHRDGNHRSHEPRSRVRASAVGRGHFDRAFVQMYVGFSAVAALLLCAIRNEAESAGRASKEDQARRRALGDNLPHGMVYQVVREHDGAVHFLYVSGSVERLMGVPSEEVARGPSGFYNLIVEEDRPLVAAARKASIQGLTTFNVTVRIRRPDGEVRWVQLSSSPRLLPDGRMLWDGVGIECDGAKARRREPPHKPAPARECRRHGTDSLLGV